MSFLDDRTKAQKINDETWRKEGQRSERAAILEFLEDWQSGEIHQRADIDDIIDLIREGNHHE